METSAEPGTILVSDNTYRLARNAFEWQALGEIPVKGMSHLMQVYRPLNSKKTEEPDQDPQDHCCTNVVIGRSVEQQTLKKSIEDLSAGKGGIVLRDRRQGHGQVVHGQPDPPAFHAPKMPYAPPPKPWNPRGGPAPGADTSLLHTQIHWLRVRCRSYGHFAPLFGLVRPAAGMDPHTSRRSVR